MNVTTEDVVKDMVLLAQNVVEDQSVNFVGNEKELANLVFT